MHLRAFEDGDTEAVVRVLAGAYAISPVGDATGFLETDRPENVRFFAGFGFVVREAARIIGVDNWFLVRTPR